MIKQINFIKKMGKFLSINTYSWKNLNSAVLIIIKVAREKVMYY